MIVLDLVGYAFAAIGTALVAIAGLGLIRLPDAYNRANAVAKAAALGVICILFGAAWLMPSPGTAAIVGLGIVLQILTTPFGAYAIGRGAHRSGAPLDRSTRHDELGDRTE